MPTIACDHNTCTKEVYDCKRCGGSGIDPNTKNCPYCTRGRVKGFRDCEKCKGNGYIIDRFGDKIKCSNCDGAKKIYVDEKCAYCNGTFTVSMDCLACKGRGKVEK